MAHSRTAKKAVRQSETRRAVNRWHLRSMRDAIKEFLDVVAHGDVAAAKASYLKAQVAIDRTAQKGVIHKNQAARRKSRLNARLKAKAGK